MELEFYDVRSKKKFKTEDYRIETREKENETTGKVTVRYFAVAKSQSGDHECWKILGREMGEKLMKK